MIKGMVHLKFDFFKLIFLKSAYFKLRESKCLLFEKKYLAGYDFLFYYSDVNEETTKLSFFPN